MKKEIEQKEKEVLLLQSILKNLYKIKERKSLYKDEKVLNDIEEQINFNI